MEWISNTRKWNYIARKNSKMEGQEGYGMLLALLYLEEKSMQMCKGVDLEGINSQLETLTLGKTSKGEVK